jgi:parallel beta-helix repeat protein
VASTREGAPRRGALAGLIGGLSLLIGIALVPTALAATIEVKPGPNAINMALAKAHDGDLLRIHNGTYREAFDITKRVTLRGVGGRPLIDARCKSRATISTTRSGVTLDHLKVVGAAENSDQGPFPSEVDFRSVATGKIHDLLIHDTCGNAADGAEYGINVFSSGPVEVSDNRITGGFSDAGIYIGGIVDTGAGQLRVINNASYLNHQGVIVEDSGFDGIVVVSNNDIHHNIGAGVEGLENGIFLHNSDRVRMRNNTVRNNGDSGINIDPNSDNARLFDNVVTSNPTDLVNDGSGNCGSGNTIGSHSGNPLGSC